MSNHNANLNDVDVPKGTEYKGKEILKVLSTSIDDDGKKLHVVLFADGSQGPVPASTLEKEAK